MVNDMRPGDPGPGRLVGVDRVLAVLIELAGHPDGASLDEVARAIDSPKPSVHRALAALRRSGLAEQDGRGHYVLGAEFLRLAFAHHEARPDHVQALGVLTALCHQFGETVHYAVLEGDDVVYRSKVDPPAGAVRLTSTVGGRNPAHSTAVGKVLLAYHLPNDDAVRAWVGERALARQTENTITTAEGLVADLRQVRRQGFSVDDQENELGINCVALPAYFTSPTFPSGAISVSGLAYRTPLARLVASVEEIRRMIAADGERAT